MSKQIIFNKLDGCVLQWQDTTQLNYAEPHSSSAMLAVTDAQWDSQHASENWYLVDGKLLPNQPKILIVEKLKKLKLAEITLQFAIAMQQIVGDTPDYEISSWNKQEAEARAFSNAATTSNPTPLIDNLAAARGIPKALLASKIISKADLFSSYSGQLIGKRQGLEDSIDAATSKTALAAITWN